MRIKRIALLVASMSCTGAYAQSTPLLPGANAELQEIVVTARKREESLQDVPLSVSAITGAELEATSSRDMKDLTNKLPNFRFVTGGVNGLTDVSIRGVDVGVQNPGFSPSVSFYVDGIYQGRPLNFNQDLVDIERVELLLGPQGTLFGDNTIAGVVNIVTKKPTDTFEAFAQISAGNYSLGDLRGSVNMPFGNGLDARVSGAITTREGYQNNIFTNNAQGNLNRGSGRVQLLQHFDGTEILLTADVQHSNEYAQNFEYAQQVFVLGVPSTYSANPRPLTISQNPSTSVVTRDQVSLNVQHQFSPTVALVSITGWKKTIGDDNIDQDYNANPKIQSNVLDNEAERLISQEFRLEAALIKEIHLTLGAYYLDDKEVLTRDFNYPPPEILLGPFGPLHFNIPTYSELDSKDYAVYANVDWKFTDHLDFNVGGRYSRVNQNTVYDQNELLLAEGGITSTALANSLLGPTHSGILVANAPQYVDSRSDSSGSGTTTLSYHFDPDRQVYIRYARGTKEGGFNLQPLPDPLPQSRAFGPEKLDDYEAGLKSEWLNKRLRVNVDGFYENYRDLQRADIIPLVPVGVTSVIRNVGKVKINGAELSVVALIGHGLQLNSSFGVANAKYVEYKLNSGKDLAGQPLSGVPKWNGSVGASYTQSIGSRYQLFTDLGADMRGATLLGASDLTAINTGGYTTFDARVGMRPAGESWEVFLWGKNLADKTYITSRETGTSFFPANLVSYGLPRTYGVTLRYNWR